MLFVFSALTLLVGWQEGHLARKKTEQWGAGMVICLERGADLHMAQLMPLPLTVSCFSKIQTGFTFLVLAHLGSPGQRDVKGGVCVCVSGISLPLVQVSSLTSPGMHSAVRPLCTDTRTPYQSWYCAILFCCLAVLDLRVGHTMDILSPFIAVLCHSDWLFHCESCPRLDVVHPGRVWSSSPACTWHCSWHYLFLQATSLFPHGMIIVC